MREQIETIQTRDSYYPIYQIKDDPYLVDGYYYWDDEEIYEDFDSNMYGPYKTVDDACKRAHKHYVAIMSL